MPMKKGKENIQWTDYIFEILLTYNNRKKHSATGFTPKEARKHSNEFSEVKLNDEGKEEPRISRFGCRGRG